MATRTRVSSIVSSIADWICHADDRALLKIFVSSLNNQKQPVSMETRSGLKTRSSAAFIGPGSVTAGLKKGTRRVPPLVLFKYIPTPLHPLRSSYWYSSSNEESSWRQMLPRFSRPSALGLIARKFSSFANISMNLFSGYYVAPLYHRFTCIFMNGTYSRMHILKSITAD